MFYTVIGTMHQFKCNSIDALFFHSILTGYVVVNQAPNKEGGHYPIDQNHIPVGMI